MPWTIYCHTHIDSGRKYVGLTKNTWQNRWKKHIYAAKSSKDGRWHFPNAIRKYGSEAFSHEVLEVCDTLEEANLAETKWIDHFKTRDLQFGFNLALGGGSQPHPLRKNPWNDPEYRAKNLPRTLSIGHTPQARAASKAALNTPESKAKRSALTKAALAKPETVAKRNAMRADPSYGIKISSATKAALASPDTKIKLINNTKARWSNSETREELEKLLQEAREKPEFKEHMSAAQKLAWQNPEIRATRIAAFQKDANRPEKKMKLSRAALGKRHSQDSINNMRLLYLQRSSSCKFCDKPIRESEKRTCINGRVSCCSCKTIHDQGIVCFVRLNGSFL
jgi:group I intron endonuclease